MRKNPGKPGTRRPRLTALGLMSGTAMDGIDLAVIHTDGDAAIRRGAAGSVGYGDDARRLLRRALADAANWPAGQTPPDSVTEAESLVTTAHEKAVREFLAGQDCTPDIIGFHGQTILHRPQEGRTVQLGDGAALARSTGIDVVNDFRSNDMEAGGQGAPLAPLYHAALAQALGEDSRIGVVNIGGVANLTWVTPDAPPVAFDTGPGNALMDDWARQCTGTPMDADGVMARSGAVAASVLERLMAAAFFERPPPKSLDRQDFADALHAVAGLSPADGAATLTEFTAAAIADGLRHLPVGAGAGDESPLWIVCGGGRRNPALMDAVRRHLPGRVKSAEDAGWNGDTLEAEAFGWLAVRSLAGLPLSLPSTTGASRPVSGGRLHRGRSGGHAGAGPGP